MSEQANGAAPVTTQASQAPVTTTPETKPQEVKSPEVKAEATPPAADKKPEDKPAVAEKVVPEKYDLKTPDGSHLKQAEVDQIAALAKERGLSNDEAQKLVEDRNQAKGGFLDQQKEEFSQLRSQWQKDFLNDPEVGGAKAQESAEHAKRFVDRYFPAEVKKAFDDFGFGDHPGLIKAFARAGKAMAEDKFVQGGASAPGEQVRTADLLYPSHSKKD